MQCNLPCRPLLVVALLAFALPTCALADKPAWIPIAELLVGSIGDSDPIRLSDVMSRCTALNMVLAGMVSETSPDMSQHYEEEALRLIQNGVLIDTRLHREMTGAEADVEAMSAMTIAKVRGMVKGYDEWLDDNMATGGSYFNSAFEMELDSCLLASKLVNQMMMSEAE